MIKLSNWPLVTSFPLISISTHLLPDQTTPSFPNLKIVILKIDHLVILTIVIDRYIIYFLTTTWREMVWRQNSRLPVPQKQHLSRPSYNYNIIYIYIQYIYLYNNNIRSIAPVLKTDFIKKNLVFAYFTKPGGSVDLGIALHQALHNVHLPDIFNWVFIIICTYHSIL